MYSQNTSALTDDKPRFAEFAPSKPPGRLDGFSGKGNGNAD